MSVQKDFNLFPKQINTEDSVVLDLFSTINDSVFISCSVGLEKQQVLEPYSQGPSVGRFLVFS